MSASLVGSEMCIRDRLWTNLITPGLPRCIHDSGFHEAFITRVSRAQEPVSYTHLTLPTICSV
eukprot:8477965-Alexandrium_andersonii.AAC.1